MSTPDISKQPRVAGGDPASKGGQWKATARPGATLNLEDEALVEVTTETHLAAARDLRLGRPEPVDLSEGDPMTSRELFNAVVGREPDSDLVRPGDAALQRRIAAAYSNAGLSACYECGVGLVVYGRECRDCVDSSGIVCRECGGPTDDGNGWDGFCGSCADLAHATIGDEDDVDSEGDYEQALDSLAAIERLENIVDRHPNLAGATLVQRGDGSYTVQGLPDLEVYAPSTDGTPRLTPRAAFALEALEHVADGKVRIGNSVDIAHLVAAERHSRGDYLAGMEITDSALTRHHDLLRRLGVAEEHLDDEPVPLPD